MTRLRLETCPVCGAPAERTDAGEWSRHKSPYTGVTDGGRRRGGGKCSGPPDKQARPLLTVPLTKAESVWVRWAIEVMPDFWKEQVRDGAAERVPELPWMDRDTLILPDDGDDVIADLLYRLEDQAPDMVSEQFDGAARANRLLTLERAADKIRKRAGLTKEKA